MIPRRNLARAFKKALGQPGYALQVFRQRFLSDLSYRFRKGKSAYPETISLFLTYQCNLRCKMCGQWGEAGSSKGYTKDKLQECLSVDEIKSLVDDVRGFKPNITLFGGEPLLYPGWEDVIRYVKAAGLRCNMISNCALLSKHAARVVDAGVDEIILSLDGPERTHDEIRGKEGAFARLREGLQALAKAKDEAGATRPLINVSSVIFEGNYEVMAETLKTCESVGASSVTFHHLIFISGDFTPLVKHPGEGPVTGWTTLEVQEAAVLLIVQLRRELLRVLQSLFAVPNGLNHFNPLVIRSHLVFQRVKLLEL